MPVRLPSRAARVATCAALCAAPLAAQQPAPQSAPQPARPAPAAEQVAAAVLPLPAELRESATVLGYDANGRLVTLREGSGAMRCLADDPALPQFHVACYHKALEPFMARGRALRAEGVKGDQVDTVRFREIAANKLAMPRTGGALYTLTSTTGGFDAASGKIAGARPLFVYYMPFATAATAGISEKASRSEPWLMYPGTPKAHVMLVGTMAP
jgi:hypothetical protein